MTNTKLNELGELLERIDIASILFKKGDIYYTSDDTRGKIDWACEFDTLYIQTKKKINSQFLMAELINDDVLRVFDHSRIHFCQTNNIEDVKNIITCDKFFLHVVNEEDNYSNFFLKYGVFITPSIVHFLKDLDKPSIYSCSLEEMKYQFYKNEIGFMSPTGYRYVVLASKLRNKGNEILASEDEGILKRGEIELKFEEARRLFCDWAPSRLSALYLMDNSYESKFNLGNMFRKSSSKQTPYIIEFKLAGLIRLIKVDYRWYEEYSNNPNEEYLFNYWSSLPFEDKSTTWEYLYEGGVLMANQKQIDYFNDKKIDLI